MGTKREKEDDFIDDSEEVLATKKKAKPSTSAKEPEERTVYNLSAKKRAQIGEFKGHKYADIREFYEEKGSGEWKPGKKGITLNKAELTELKKVIDDLIGAL
ncbi:UNVERIFIED_CONTAM: Transcriptional coactivator [Siphonaria sp. JEL0065]|nr:Transcriptional coactivator [Siphonaria sp. JEL0065]